MKKTKSSRITSKNKLGYDHDITREGRQNTSLESLVKEWHKEVELLSYEKSLEALDVLLEALQNDSVPVEELQQHYLKGNNYLDHCENLLKTIEQDVIQLNSADLK